MARHKKFRHGKSKAIPVAIVAPLAYMGYETVKNASKGDWNGVQGRWTGYDINSKKFKADQFMQTYVPILAGVIVHKVANRTGVNNIARKATMGYFSI